MRRMVLTLEVLRLSGWLNADALCRGSKSRRTMRGEVWAGKREGRGQRRHTQRAGEGSTADGGAGNGQERTRNMPYMLVTLEVSKLSGWLNDDAL